MTQDHDYALRDPLGWPSEMPSSGGTMRPRFFRTVSGPGGTPYPKTDDNPTVYNAVKLIDVKFTETVGAQSLIYNETIGEHRIFNLSTEDYIDEGDIVLCWKLDDLWYTIDKVKVCDDVFATTRKYDADGNLLWSHDNGAGKYGGDAVVLDIAVDANS